MTTHCSEPAVSDTLTNCGICYTPYDEASHVAKILHCGHTFCENCVKNMYKYNVLRKIGALEKNSEQVQDSLVPMETEKEEDDYEKIFDECFRECIVRVKECLTTKFETYREECEEYNSSDFIVFVEQLTNDIESAIEDFDVTLSVRYLCWGLSGESCEFSNFLWFSF
ncbi:unnamed protein product [Caenorhabditis bovis]|uniref:RING-type domain-containing protein n=1 Tax=Caenorhabditis bovis TaxID=2654633 RepID=A0A8S1F1L3_9PELO|nr:unnamed protein product [Caenorhabditis bovis]